MNTPAALVQAFLTPNLKDGLPIVLMLLMIQGIHPEIIFVLVQHVQMSQRQYNEIIMAWTQLRLFASVLPAVKGVKPQTFQGQRSRFRKFPQDPVSRVFAYLSCQRVPTDPKVQEEYDENFRQQLGRDPPHAY